MVEMYLLFNHSRCEHSEPKFLKQQLNLLVYLFDNLLEPLF